MIGDPESRESAVIEAFVNLSSELVDDYDVAEMLTRLANSCVDLLGVAAAGLMLRDGHGVLHLAGCSSEDPRHVEAFQRQRDQGPCLDAFLTMTPVTAVGQDEIDRVWPRLSAALPAEVASVHAFPLRVRAHQLGALGLLDERAGALDAVDLALARALVHVASVAVVNQQSAADQSSVTEQLQHALMSRIVLEQAKGVLAASGDLEMADAFQVLRRYARDHRSKLTHVAAAVANRSLRPEALLGQDHSSGTQGRRHPQDGDA